MVAASGLHGPGKLILPVLDSATLGQGIATREHVEAQYLAVMTGGNSGIAVAGALAVGIMLLSGVPAAAPSVDRGGEGALTGGPPLVDPEWRTGLTTAAFVQFRITHRFGFQPEVMFSMNGAFNVVAGVTPLFHLNAKVALADAAQRRAFAIHACLKF